MTVTIQIDIFHQCPTPAKPNLMSFSGENPVVAVAFPENLLVRGEQNIAVDTHFRRDVFIFAA